MNYKKKVLMLILGSGAVSAVVYLNRYFTDVGIFLFAFSTAFCGIFVGLYFTGQKAFDAWKRFALTYLTGALVLIALSPATNMQFIGVDREMITLWLAAIFFIISLVIIIKKREKHSPLDLHDC